MNRIVSTLRTILVLLGIWLTGSIRAEDGIERAEARRIETIARISPSVVCIYDPKLRGGGSGVLIHPDGYGLTNYHVVAEALETRRAWGGLPDGKLYELEVLGIDPTGDVAMFKLVGDKPFPYATLGDSDMVQLGDQVMALGNPFTLSEDYTPTVTAGIVTGLHRFQSGVGKNLVYSDCIQVDASINPGNSGGPLFNAAGEVIGINGRISVSRRGRLNVGFGYAIAVDQIQRFIPALRAGLHAYHGTLQATVVADPDGVLAFQRIAPQSSAAKAGLESGDRLLRFDGVTPTSPNHYVSLLGAYPGDWPIPLTVDRQGATREVVVRLDVDKPKSQRPFAPRREVGLRETHRILKRFQSAALPADAPRPTGWKWKLTRTVVNAAATERYDVSQVGDGPLRIHRRFDDGTEGSKIIATDTQVIENLARDDQEMTVSLDIEMVWAAMYVLHRRLLEPAEMLDLSAVHPIGGDRIIRAGGTPDRILEVLDWQVLANAWAKLAFDAETGRLDNIRVRDIPTGQEVLLQLGDYKDIGGVIWPTSFDVTAGTRRYRDVTSNWEVAR